MRNFIFFSSLVIISIFVTPACVNDTGEESSDGLTEDSSAGVAGEVGLTERMRDDATPDQAPEEGATADVDASSFDSNASTTAYLQCGFNPRGWSGNYLYYTIVNCHSYTVKREIEINNGRDDCYCHTLSPGEAESGYCHIAPWESPRKIKEC